MRKLICGNTECKKPFSVPHKQGFSRARYCSVKCRTRIYTLRYANARTEWQRDQRGGYKQGRIQCLLCPFKWFDQIGSHIFQTHGMTARDYRVRFGLDVKRGLLSPRLRDLKSAQVFENGTVSNLKVGKKFWFKKGDKRAGDYIRSKQTMDRLKNLSNFRDPKIYGKDKKSKMSAV